MKTKSLLKMMLTAGVAAAFALTPCTTNAQSRSGGSSRSSSSSPASKSSSSASRSSSSGSRSSASGQSRASKPQNQSSSRAQGGTVSRSGGKSSGSASRSGNTSSVKPSQPSSKESSSGKVTVSSRKGSSGSSVSSKGAGNNRGYNTGNSYSRQTAGAPGQVRFDDHGHRVAPKHRPPMSYERPGHFYGRHPHYYGYRVSWLPRYERRRYWGRDYYFYNGIYYRFLNDVYYVTRPPYGILFDRALYELELDVLHFAYYSNVYRTYNTVNSNYATINEQNRIIAENNATIAAQNATIAQNNATMAAQASASSANREMDMNTLKSYASYQLATKLGLVQSFAANGQEYYYDDGVFFVAGDDGKYKVIVPPAGALIKALPEDYDTVTLSDGNEYYKVDDTIYRMTVSDGVPYFEVLGQLAE